MVENVKVTGTKKENKILAWAKKHKTGLLVAAGSIAGLATVGVVGHCAYEFGKRSTQSMPIIELTGNLINEIREGHGRTDYSGNESCMLIPTSEVKLTGFNNPVVTIDTNGIVVNELLDHYEGHEIFDDALKECFKFDDADPVMIYDTLLYD